MHSIHTNVWQIKILLSLVDYDVMSTSKIINFKQKTQTVKLHLNINK